MIDEIQHVSELLSWIQVRVDEQPTMGCFILTGSHQFTGNFVHYFSPAAVVREYQQASD